MLGRSVELPGQIIIPGPHLEYSDSVRYKDSDSAIPENLLNFKEF